MIGARRLGVAGQDCIEEDSDVSNDFESALEGLLGKKDWMSILLAEEPTSGSAAASIRQFMLAMREHEPMLPELTDKLADQIIGYCLPRKRLLKAIKDSGGNPNDLSSAMASLRREARQAFQQYREDFPARSGEGGELLAYVFTEHFLRAPMAVAKMHTKTNTNMPVFGADGIHVRYASDTATLEVFYLESKVHGGLSSAARDAAKSMGDLMNGGQRGRELRLALDFGNFDHMDEAAQQALEDFLDPYGSKTASRRDRHVCLIAYSEAAYKSKDDPVDMDAVRAKFRSRCKDRTARVEAAYAGNKLPTDKITTYVVGFPSVASFRRAFERALSNG
jgi:hypothetical protein